MFRDSQWKMDFGRMTDEPPLFSQNFRSTPEEGRMALNGFNMHQAHMHDRWGHMESNPEEKTLLLGPSQYGIYRYWIVCGCIYYSKSMPKMDSVRGIKGGFEDAFEYEANIAGRQFSESFPVYKWTTRRVPYIISKEMSPNMTSAILEAIKSWNENFGNCINWIPRKIQKDYVYFTNGSFCHSEVGRVKYKQLIVLNEANCMGRGFILHEMMHAVGFTHEHNRPDRDKYIEVLFLNIPYEWRNQYKKESLEAIMELGPYDYYSLMHYELQSPDRDKPAFRVIPEGVDVSRIGQRNFLSEIDKLKVMRLYCPEKLI